MSDKDLPVKEISLTIQRGKHDKENPYVMISKKMLRDKELSPKAKGVLSYLLSFPDTWKTNARKIAKDLGIGKDQVYKILKEFLKTGYAYKTEIKGDDGRFAGINYEFFEEKLPEKDRFKEKITVSGNPDAVEPDTEIQTISNKEYIDKEYINPPIPPKNEEQNKEAEASEMEIISSSKDKPKKTKAPEAFTPQVIELAEKMVSALHSANPDWIIPKNLHFIKQQIDEMITKELRDPKKILDVFMWAVNDAFWMDKLCKANPAKYLRGQFAQLSGKMNAKPQVNPNEIDRRLRHKDGSIFDYSKEFKF